MPTIKIVRTYDEHDCDDCGLSTADGATVYIDDKRVLILKPVAHCYGGMTYNDEDIFKAVLEYIDYTVEVIIG